MEEDKERADEILKRLHQQAEIRKRKKQKISDDVTETSEEVDKKKRRKSLASENENEIVAKLDNIVLSPKCSRDKEAAEGRSVKSKLGVIRNENDKKELDVEIENINESVESDLDRDSGVDELDDAAEGPSEVGGFTVLGDFRQKEVQKVKRVLPDWLSKPTVIEGNIRQHRSPFSEFGLDDDLVEALEENGIKDLFPVQSQLIPEILGTLKPSYFSGLAGYRPHDICCSSPTGSGKTLAFVLPIVQALRQRVVCQVRALVVLPVRDLATQVYKVFLNYCNKANLKVALVTGQKPLPNECKMLVRKGVRGYQSLVDIVVATPGRLVDHIQQTPGFSLKHLRFLVIDEADRMMDEIKQDWLSQVEAAMNKGQSSSEVVHNLLTPSRAVHTCIPAQKLLFSATLSQNPEKLQQLNLFQPKLFTAVVEGGSSVQYVKDSGEFVGKYTTPTGLTEYFIEATPSERPLMVLHALLHLKFRHVLCFTNSVEAAHRLNILLNHFDDIIAKEFSSNLHGQRRTKLIKQFEKGKIDVLICSDAMARGMDVENVQCVISYEAPPYLKTYIHRIGRTARAGRVGTSMTLLEKKQIRGFKRMLSEAGKTSIKELKITETELEPLMPKYEDALKSLATNIQEKKNKNKKSFTNKKKELASKPKEETSSESESESDDT